MKRIVFVCVENSNRSQMAEAFARIHGARVTEAFSAGSPPSGRVNPKAIAAMREIGYDLTQHQSKSLSDLPDIDFDAAITMGCGDECPLLRAQRREDWKIPDPKEMSPEQFAAIRDLIQAFAIRTARIKLCVDVGVAGTKPAVAAIAAHKYQPSEFGTTDECLTGRGKGKDRWIAND